MGGAGTCAGCGAAILVKPKRVAEGLLPQAEASRIMAEASRIMAEARALAAEGGVADPGAAAAPQEQAGGPLPGG